MPPESTSDERTVNNVMRHEYRVLSDDEKLAMQRVKDVGILFHELIDSLGSSREVSIAKTKTEEAVMWAVKHITSDNPPSLRRTLVDLFDRIAAAIAAKNSGDSPALDEHLAAIDAHLQSLDSDDTAAKAAVLTLQGDDTSSQGRLTAIEAGLQKVADAVNPPPPPAVSVSPAAISSAVGAGITVSLSVTGGTSPYSFSSSLGDVSVDSSGNVSGTPTAAETGLITVTDSGGLTATVPVTIS
jgi:hypothetical protein